MKNHKIELRLSKELLEELDKLQQIFGVGISKQSFRSSLLDWGVQQFKLKLSQNLIPTFQSSAGDLKLRLEKEKL